MESLIVFAKSPRHGHSKTRLAKTVGDDFATKLYGAFLVDMAATLRAWHKPRIGVDPNRRTVLYCTPGADDPALIEIARRAGARIAAQSEGDLGQRLDAAFAEEFSRGARSVCAIGTDSPTLPVYLLDHAFRSLLFERVTIGPSFDGGYWLIGAQRSHPRELFVDIPWSTDAVTEKTCAALASVDITPHLLPFWYDVDDESDLQRLRWHVAQLPHREVSATAAALKDTP